MGVELALVQMAVTGGDLPGNLARAEARIAEAAAHGSRLVVLPETMDLGWLHPAAAEQAAPIPDGLPFRRLAAAAARHRVIVCAGLTERCGEAIYNAAVIISADGALLALHRKLNELEIGHGMYDQGDRLGVARTGLGTIGLMICADGFAEDLAVGRALGYMGADLIVSPCAWAVPEDHDQAASPYGGLWRRSYAPVAREFAMWIAGVSNVGPIAAGPWAGRRCIGCSLVIDPDGREVLQGPYGVDAEVVLYLDVDLRPRPARGGGWSAWQRTQPTEGV